MKNADFYIRSYDAEPPPFGPCACFRRECVRLGERTDWLRISLSPILPDRLGPDDAGGGFLVAPRFAGDSIDPPRSFPVHVHVYLVILRNPPSNGIVSTDDIADFKWATLHPTLELVLDNRWQ
jgi:hypothetical protein